MKMTGSSWISKNLRGPEQRNWNIATSSICGTSRPAAGVCSLSEKHHSRVDRVLCHSRKAYKRNLRIKIYQVSQCKAWFSFMRYHMKIFILIYWYVGFKFKKLLHRIVSEISEQLKEAYTFLLFWDNDEETAIFFLFTWLGIAECSFL